MKEPFSLWLQKMLPFGYWEAVLVESKNFQIVKSVHHINCTRPRWFTALQTNQILGNSTFLVLDTRQFWLYFVHLTRWGLKLTVDLPSCVVLNLVFRRWLRKIDYKSFL